MKVLYQSCMNTLVSPFQLLAKRTRQTIQNALSRLFVFKSSGALQWDSRMHQQPGNLGRVLREFSRKAKLGDI